LNAARQAGGDEAPFVLSRADAYIGVLIDDLINKGTKEPYRMFTSRAEYRILLRQDNADVRLTPLAHKLGIRDMEERMERTTQKVEAAEAIDKYFRKTSVSPDQLNGFLEGLGSSQLKQKVKLHGILLRPKVDINALRKVLPELNNFLSQYPDEFVDLAEINMKYEGYIQKEQEMVDKMNRLEEVRLHDNFDYHQLVSLSSEAREKLSRLKPRTIGQASRISGISPSDISVLLVHMGR
jgi:tRNA uridine 5-carboxymethylaminomethyl modification enzyme